MTESQQPHPAQQPLWAYPPAPYPEPAGTTPIAWQTQIGAQAYTYVALPIRGFGWFLTGQLTHPLSWDALCYHFPPNDGRFLVLGVVGQIVLGGAA